MSSAQSSPFPHNVFAAIVQVLRGLAWDVPLRAEPRARALDVRRGFGIGVALTSFSDAIFGHYCAYFASVFLSFAAHTVTCRVLWATMLKTSRLPGPFWRCHFLFGELLMLLLVRQVRVAPGRPG